MQEEFLYHPGLIKKVIDGKTVGTLLYEIQGDTLHMLFLKIKPEFQKKKIAGTLIMEAEKIAKKEGLARVIGEITSVEYPQFIAWIERNGKWSNASVKEVYALLKKNTFKGEFAEIEHVKEFAGSMVHEGKDAPANFTNIPMLKLTMALGFVEKNRVLSDIHKGKKYVVADAKGRVSRTDEREKIKDPAHVLLLYFPVYVMEKQV